MELTGLNDWGTQEKIIKRVEEKEYINRCLAVDICPVCGRDHENVEPFNSNFFAMACTNKGCSEYKIIRKTTR